jgi:hypothetical protein
MIKTLKTHKFGMIIAVVLAALTANALIFAVTVCQTALSGREKIVADMHQTLNDMRRMAIENDTVPPAFNSPFMTYVIERDQGTFVAPRTAPLNLKQRDLWDYHRTRIIYQMQKQADGQIQYPQQTGLRQFTTGNNIILFTSLAEPGWILVTEAYLPSLLQMFQTYTNPILLLNLLAISLITIFLMIYIISRKLTLISKLIADNLESGLTHMNTLSEWSEPAIKLNPTPEMITQPDAFSKLQSGHALEVELTSNLQTPDDSTAPLLGIRRPNEEKAPSGDSGWADNPQQTAPHSAREKQRRSKRQSPKGTRQEENPHTESEPAYDDLTLNLQDIKSPVLKKMIHRMRNHK